MSEAHSPMLKLEVSMKDLLMGGTVGGQQVVEELNSIAIWNNHENV